MKKLPLFNKIENFFGTLKCAVVIILLFTILMILGTFAESYYGTEYANRLIYKKWPFMLVQLVMFLSIIMATFKRFPFKKPLYGFYTLHLGLILIFCGSFITWHSGIDGNITLVPGIPSRSIELPKDQLKITVNKDQNSVLLDLPNTTSQKDLDSTFGDIKVKSFIPYSKNEIRWKNSNKNFLSASYTISNEMVAQEFTLSNHPDAKSFKSTLSMGPLTVHFLPKSLYNCFKINNPSKLIIWDSNTGVCFTPESKKLIIKETTEKNRFVVLPHEGKFLSFFPDFSPWPLDEKFQILKDSPFKIFSKKLFESKPNLFLFGSALAYFEDDEWVSASLERSKSHELPWMGFEVQLIKEETSSFPYQHPVETTPVQKDGQIIQGNQRAVEIEFRGESHWVTDIEPIYLEHEGDWTKVAITKQQLTLPFEFLLTNFKMETDPGTNNPASYESFVQLFEDQKGGQNHHIYMNNPLKHSGFTFYQASYFKTESGSHGSVLSANYDPGRPVKYFGSLLLVLGTIYHYLLRRKKKAQLKGKFA